MSLRNHVDRNLWIYLNNFYVDNGSFKGLSKINNKVYRHLLNLKKEIDPDNPSKLTDWLKSEVLYKYTVPPATKSKLDIPLYNMLVNAVSIAVSYEADNMKHFPTDMLNGFLDSFHMKKFEPAYYKFLQDRIPKYMGALPEDSELNLKIEGYKYWGQDLTEQCHFVDDLIAFFRGHKKSHYLTPSISQKVSRMLSIHGNLNLIGLDEMDLLYDLNKLVQNSRAKSIKELINLEGVGFEPVEYNLNDRILYLKRTSNYSLVIEGCELEVIIASEIYDELKQMGALQSLKVEELNTMEGKTHLLVMEQKDGGADLPVHVLFTRNTNSWFIDNNTLNLRKANLTF